MVDNFCVGKQGSLVFEARLGDKKRASAERWFRGTEKEEWERVHTQKTVGSDGGITRVKEVPDSHSSAVSDTQHSGRLKKKQLPF